jgi:nucleotide-binding universal stress UspA family protein
MVWFAFDGSLHCDWLSHYAVRCAEQSAHSRLSALFVRDGSLSDGELELRFSRLARLCDSANIEFDKTVLNPTIDVITTLLTHVRQDEQRLLLCGTRVKRRKSGFLKGTVSEQLLHHASCPVLAIHISSPGLLGRAQRLLLPVMGHPGGGGAARPFLLALSQGLEQIFVVSVHSPSGAQLIRLRGKYPHLNSEADRRAYVAQIVQQLDRTFVEQGGNHHRIAIDQAVIISDHPGVEIVLAAKQHKSQFILLGMTERSLARRALSPAPSETVLRYAPCDVGIFGGKR